MNDASRRDPLTLYQFTVTNLPGPTQDDVAALLRRTADELDALGAVGVRDITFHVDTSDDETWPSMTVYYDLDDGSDAPIVIARNAFGTRTVRADDDEEYADGDEDDEDDGEDDGIDDDDRIDLVVDDDDADERAEASETVDVATAEAEEAAATHDAASAPAAPAREINPEWFMPPVLERLAPPADHDDDVLPTNGAPVQPVASFPVRMPPTVDRSGFKRIRELLRSTTRRRNGVD